MTPREEIDLLRREVADLRARIAMLEARQFQQQPVVVPQPYRPYDPWIAPSPPWQPPYWVTCGSSGHQQ